jgi:hypothetical protein
MELAKNFDKSKQLDRLPKRGLNRLGLTFGARLEQHVPIPVPTSLRASAASPKPPQLVLHTLWIELCTGRRVEARAGGAPRGRTALDRAERGAPGQDGARRGWAGCIGV